MEELTVENVKLMLYCLANECVPEDLVDSEISLDDTELPHVCYGLKVDDEMYDIGDTYKTSTSLFDDDCYDDHDRYYSDNYVEPYRDDSYATVIAFDPYADNTIQSAIDIIDSQYRQTGKYIYLLAGDYLVSRNADTNEIVMQDAEIVCMFD